MLTNGPLRVRLVECSYHELYMKAKVRLSRFQPLPRLYRVLTVLLPNRVTSSRSVASKLPAKVPV